jgi:hypothetical protein
MDEIEKVCDHKCQNLSIKNHLRNTGIWESRIGSVVIKILYHGNNIRLSLFLVKRRKLLTRASEQRASVIATRPWKCFKVKSRRIPVALFNLCVLPFCIHDENESSLDLSKILCFKSSRESSTRVSTCLYDL